MSRRSGYRTPHDAERFYADAVLIGLYAPELGKTISRHKIDGGDVDAALELIAAAKRRLEKLGRPVRVVSIYEDSMGSG